MKPNEKAELERQGAKAAVRGEDALMNPMLLLHNMPLATGETRQEWRQRLDAWQAGYEQQALKPLSIKWLPTGR
jgi:hypothetical protein